MHKLSQIPIILFIVILVGITIMQSFFVLANAEVAVVERFGEKSRVITQSGVNFKVPFIDQARIINVNEEYSIQYGYRPDKDPTPTSVPDYKDVQEEEIVLTKGPFLVNVGAVIQYRITSPSEYLYNVDDQIGTLRLAFESVLRRNMQNQALDSALINKDSIAREVMPDLSRKIDQYGLGITILDVKLTDVLLEASVQKAYEDVLIAKNEKEEYASKAQKYSNEKLPEARAQAYDRIQKAEAYKARTISQAKGDVENFSQVYEKYKSAQDITKTRLYIETMEKIMKNVTDKVIVDVNDNSTMKYIPVSPREL